MGGHGEGALALDAIIEQLQRDYQRNTERRHRDAFAVIDEDGDKLLQKDEFVTALLPGSDRNKARSLVRPSVFAKMFLSVRLSTVHPMR